MTIKRSVLSKQQIKERIKNLAAIIQTKFDISYEEIEDLIKNNKDLIHVDQSEFVPCLQHLQSAYGLKDFQINQILYNSPLLFFDLSNLKEKEELLFSILKTTPTQFGFICLNNPLAITMSNEDLQKLIRFYTNEINISQQLVKSIMTRTNNFVTPKGLLRQLPLKLELLELFGISEYDVIRHPSICGNAPKKILRRLELAKLNNFALKDYLNFKFMMSEAKIYARHKALEFGIIDIPNIYIQEEELAELTDFSTQELMRTFPFDDAAKESLDKEFSESYPELDRAVQKVLLKIRLLERQQEQKAEQKTEQKVEIVKNQPVENTPPRESLKFKFLELFGIPRETAEKTSIYYNSTSIMLRKLMLSKINNYPSTSYINERHFISSEALIYAKMRALESGTINIPNIYISNKQLLESTGYTGNQLIAQFPYDDEAKKYIDERFAEEFPELSRVIIDVLLEHERHDIITINHAPEGNHRAPHAVEDAPPRTSTTLSAAEKQLKRFKRITQLSDAEIQYMTTKLNREIKLEQLNLLALNYITLREYGFSKEEIVERPKALLIQPDKLTLRAKLAKINGRTTKQFLSKDFEASEETISIRTLGIKNTNTSRVASAYCTEADFCKKFGMATRELRSLYPFDHKAVLAIDELYQKTIRQESGDESEQ